jgi:AraC-like DNA-binding protein
MAKKEPQENVEFQRIVELDGLEVVKAAYFRHHFPKHSHDVFAFGIVEHGAQATEYRGATHIAVAGDICLVNPGEVHTGYAPDDQGWSYRCCYPDPGLLSDIARQGDWKETAPPHFPSPVIRDPMVYRHFYRFFQAIEDHEDSLCLQERLIAAISSALSRHGACNASSKDFQGGAGHVRRACNYMEERWSEQPLLNDIATAAGLDSYSLIRVFRRHMGMTPHAYLMQTRIARGKTLLTMGRFPAQVALDSGFFDQSHFTKQFKRFTGTTPSAYRDAVAGRNDRRGS